MTEPLDAISGECGPVDLRARRELLFREAAADMADLRPAQRTLAEFERRTAEKADARGWARAGFATQHLRHHPELKAIYETARFPNRSVSAPAAPRGTRRLDEDELRTRLAVAIAERDEERKARKEAERRVEQTRLDNAAEVVRQFIAAMGLTPKMTTGEH